MKAFLIFGILILIPHSAFCSAALEKELKQKQQAGPQALQQQYNQKKQQIDQQYQSQQAQLQHRQQALQQQILQQRQAFQQNLSQQISQIKWPEVSTPSVKLPPMSQPSASSNFSFPSLSSPGISAPSLGEYVDPSQVADVKSLVDIWRALEKNSEVWPLIIELQPKIITVERQIGLYQNQGITISKPAMHYVQMIDDISMQNPAILEKPFREVLKFVAVVEYDFDSGQDKDTLARQVLGERLYLDNKQRLGY